MTAAFAILVVMAVAAFVVLPLFGATEEGDSPLQGTGSELWNHEKAVAVLAIAEADFDRATGKLSDEDYRVLRSDYEGRALQAMDEIDKLAPALSPGASDRFCGGCGAAFADSDAFCGQCGYLRRRE